MNAIRLVLVVTAWLWVDVAVAADPAVLHHCLAGRGDAYTHIYIGEFEVEGRLDCLALQVDCRRGCMTRVVLLPGMEDPASVVVGAAAREGFSDVRAHVTVADWGWERPVELTYVVHATPSWGDAVDVTHTMHIVDGRLKIIDTRTDGWETESLLAEPPPVGKNTVERRDMRPSAEAAPEADWRGLRPFEAEGLWGLLDEADEVVVPARHAMTLNLDTPWLAAVHEEGRWLVVNRHGDALFEAYAEQGEIDPFSEGLARFVHEGKVGFYDRLGRVVIQARFDRAGPFEGGVARVQVKGRWKAVDKRGAPARAR